jgi:hypothetical protein
MRRNLSGLAIGLVLLLVLLGCGTTPNGEAATPTGGTDIASNPPIGPVATAKWLLAPKPMVVPAGTPLVVRLDQTISSKQNGSGDTFTATVVEPIVIDGKTVVPRGSEVEGVVENSARAGHFKGSAHLAVTLESLTVGKDQYAIQTSTVGRATKGRGKRSIAWIAGGAGAGALIGALAGGGKGAGIGALSGGGAGTGVAAFTGKRDVALPAEARLSFRLTEPVAVRL